MAFIVDAGIDSGVGIGDGGEDALNWMRSQVGTIEGSFLFKNLSGLTGATLHIGNDDTSSSSEGPFEAASWKGADDIVAISTVSERPCKVAS
jgi:hypothetical protein